MLPSRRHGPRPNPATSLLVKLTTAGLESFRRIAQPMGLRPQFVERAEFHAAGRR
jgi:hypothetical protein